MPSATWRSRSCGADDGCRAESSSLGPAPHRSGDDRNCAQRSHRRDRGLKTNLMRTAYNMIIYEALDFTVGLFDAEGNTVSIGLGLPMFIRGMSATVKAKIRHFAGNIDPGDILLTNDAYT